MTGRLLGGAVEVQDAGDRLVEQVEVVADHEERAAVAAEEPQQPRLGVGVEVVGGLVEQEHVAAGEQDAGQLDPAPLAAGQHADRQVEAVGAEAQAGGQRAGLGFGGVAAVVAERSSARVYRATLRLARVLLEAQAQLLEPHRRLVEAAAAEHVARRR